MEETQTSIPSKFDKNQPDAEKWQNRFNFAEQAQRPLFKRIEKNYDILYAVFNTDNIAPWRSKVYVPTLASKAWDLIARLSEIQPIFSVNIENELEQDPETGEIGYAPGVEERKEKIEDKLEDDYCHTSGEPMKLKTFNTLSDAVVAGTGFAKVSWVVEKDVKKARPVDEQGMVDLSQEIVKESEKGHNDFEPINVFNVFVAPNSASFYSAPYIIVRHFTTRDAAKKTGLYDDKAIDNLIESNQNASQFSIYNQSRNRVLNTRDQNDQTVDNIVLYECYDQDGTMYVYGEGGNTATDKNTNGWLEVRKEKEMYWHGQYPLVPFYIRKKSFSPFGESLFENNSRLNAAVNDLFNHYLDNWNLSIDSMLMYEDNSLQNDFVVEPGGEIIYSGEKPTQFKFPEPNPQQLSVVMGVLNQAIEAATVPQYLSGVPDSSLDKTQGTATGVKNITEAATEKVGFMRDNMKQSMKVVGNMWLSNLQQFMDTPAEITTVVKGKPVPKILMPGDVQGEMSVEIDDDSMIPITKEARKQTYKDLIENLGGIQKLAIQQYEITQDKTDVPRMAWSEIAEDMTQQYAIKDSNKYFLAEKPDDPNAKKGGPSQKLIESMNFKDQPLDTQQDMIVQETGKPSVLLAAQIKQAMADLGLQDQATQTASDIVSAPQGASNG